MEAIMEIANRHNIPVIEDNAQAIGGNITLRDGNVKKTGTLGTIGTTSFFPSKNLGCYGDGGAMFTNDDALAEKLRKARKPPGDAEESVGIRDPEGQGASDGHRSDARGHLEVLAWIRLLGGI